MTAAARGSGRWITIKQWRWLSRCWAPPPWKGNRLGAHKLTFPLTFAHSRRVSSLLVLPVVAGPMMGRSAEQLPNEGRTWAPVDFHATVLCGRVCGALFHPSTWNRPAANYSDIPSLIVHVAPGSNNQPVWEEESESAHILGGGAQSDSECLFRPWGFTGGQGASHKGSLSSGKGKPQL